MTDKTVPRRRSRPALASRILVGGASVAATIGLIGGMAAAGREQAASPPAPIEEQPIRIVVVHKKGPSVRQTRSATAKPRIVRRYVRRAPPNAQTAPAASTSTRAS